MAKDLDGKLKPREEWGEGDEKEPDFTSHKIILPEDDYDEDDAMDARIEEFESKQRRRITRGGFFSTQ